MLRIKINRLAHRWMPPRLFVFFRTLVRGYASWRNLSANVKNWRFCWLVETFKPLGSCAGRHYQLGARQEKLITVHYHTGMRLLSYPACLGVVHHAQTYFDRLGLMDELPSGHVMIDIGAHVGAVSLPVAFGGATVFAYEPHPDNFHILELNKTLNQLDNLHVFQCAVSDSIGTTTFEFGRTSTTGSLRAAGVSFRKQQAETIEVRATTLAAIFSDHAIEEVGFLKIDTEGGEYEILFAEAAGDVLKKCHTLFLEVHPVTTDHDKYQLYAHLVNLGFRIKVIENLGNGCADFYCTNSRFSA